MFQVASGQGWFVLYIFQLADAFLHGGKQRPVVLKDVFDITKHGCQLFACEHCLALPGIV